MYYLLFFKSSSCLIAYGSSTVYIKENIQINVAEEVPINQAKKEYVMYIP